ncbi:hypothetical protein AOQ84DRAFT_17126 [Glonium stellatum]|uniref:Uncharacterized protein n=1 Tax=Glonium stellatum TaxID=574774 RepID=A0A8E2F2W4_9PEZI|nr:hypothetical protein AOQ84DRAFT_17126 [Glonium stellatum]
MSENSQSASCHTLAYPSVAVHSTLASLASENLNMRSHTKKHTEETPSSLEDSTYEVLGDSSFETSDDEEGRTESLASTDGHTPDDISSIADTEESDDSFALGASEHHPDPLVGSTTAPFNRLVTDDVGTHSDITTRADVRSVTSSYIQFEEPQSSSKEDEMDVCHVIRSFDTFEIPDVLRLYNCPQIRLTARQALSKNYLTLKRPFRIMYVGEATHWAKQDIINKIASALTASSDSMLDSHPMSERSSRFNVFPITSFGEKGSSPQVELIDSSGIELVVHQCTSALMVHSTKSETSSTIQLTLKDTTRLLFAPGSSVEVIGEAPPTHYLPDLTVICHTFGSRLSSSDEEMSQHQLIREAMRSQSIPILDIAMVVPFHQCPDSYTFSSKSLRLCIEGRNSEEPNHRILETLPINISSFLEIDASQLNRHLACVTRLEHEGSQDATLDLAGGLPKDLEQPMEKKALGSGWNILNFFSNAYGMKNCHEYAKASKPGRVHSTTLRTLTVATLALVTVSVTISLQALNYLSTRVEPTWENAALSSAISTLTPSAHIWSQVHITESPKSSVAIVQTPPNQDTKKELSMVNPEKSLGRPLTHTLLPRANDSNQFKIHIIGDYHFVLTPPLHFAKLKKPPQLHIRVSRGSRSIPSQISKLVEGVHAVELEREDAHGLLNVTIWTDSKPLILQSFDVRFSSPWLKLSAWTNRAEKLSNVVKRDVTLAQVGLRSVPNQLYQSVFAGMSQAEENTKAAPKDTKYWRDKVKLSTRGISEHLQATKRESIQQITSHYRATKDISRKIHQFKGLCAGYASELTQSIRVMNMMEVWRKTSSLRTSRPLLGARSNALKLWKKLGKQSREDPTIFANGKNEGGFYAGYKKPNGK